METTTKKVFTKPALNIDEQITLLSARGLKFNDVEKIKHYLTYIGYYRLSAYMRPFQNAEHNFVIPCDFEDVLNLYFFDKKLRQLTFSAVKQIEIALRSVITNTMASEYGAYWFNDARFFDAKINNSFHTAQNIIKDVTKDCSENKKTVFIKHYYDTYKEPELPPSWMVFEALSMGSVSMLYKLLEREHRKKIAVYFGQDEIYLTSWAHSLTHIRNICAHHLRLWNRIFSIKPKINKRIGAFNRTDYSREKFYVQAVIIETLLNKIEPQNTWQEDFNDLIMLHKINTKAMGYPKG